MTFDDSHYFVSLLKELSNYEEEINVLPEWQTLKKEYYTGYCSLMERVHTLRPGIGFHVYSIVPKQFAEDNVTLMLNPDVDALMTFCISLHKMGIHTTWACNEIHWIVFIYKKIKN